MAREDLVLDLIYGEYHGASKDSVRTDKGVKPKVRSLSKHPIAAITGTKVFPIPLSSRKHVFNIEVPGGAPDLKILRPTPDMENVDYDSTVWAQIMDEDEEEYRSLKEERDRLQNRISRMEKQIERLEDEEGEKEKRDQASKSGGGSKTFECDYCGHDMPVSKWKEEDGVCPECNAMYERFEGDD